MWSSVVRGYKKMPAQQSGVSNSPTVLVAVFVAATTLPDPSEYLPVGRDEPIAPAFTAYTFPSASTSRPKLLDWNHTHATTWCSGERNTTWQQCCV